MVILLVGVACAALGYALGLSQAKRMVSKNTLSRDEQDAIRQVLNVLSFGGVYEDKENTH